MAETKNIKELSHSDSMAEGDYFLIETPAGTQLLDFANFVIDQDNTTFAADLQTNVTTLSTVMESVSAATDLLNPDSTISIINATLTESINSLQTTLFGETFEATLQTKRDIADPDPVTQAARPLNSHLEALSASVFDNVYSIVRSLSADVIGDSPITERDQFTYLATNPAGSPGGLLGAVYDQALNQNDTFIQSIDGGVFFNKETGNAGQYTTSIDNNYNVSVNSLSFNVSYENIPTDSARKTGDCPYANPGTFVITSYEATTGINNTTHTWTINRVGGSEFVEDDGAFQITLVGHVVAKR